MKESKDLWRVCMRSPSSTMRIPELEFEAGYENKRTIDSIYNHLTKTTFTLSRYAEMPGQLTTSDREKILETVNEINKLLDLQTPWTFEIEDPTGLSEIQPMDGVEIINLDEEPEPPQKNE